MCITIARCRSHVPTRQTARATSTWNGCIGLPGVHHRDPLLGVWRSRQPPLVRMVCQRAAAWPPPPPGRARLRILRQTFLPSVGTTSFSRGVRKGNAQSKRRETRKAQRNPAGPQMGKIRHLVRASTPPSIRLSGLGLGTLEQLLPGQGRAGAGIGCRPYGFAQRVF